MRPLGFTVAVALAASGLLSACGGSPVPSVKRSGVAVLDQTAAFVRWSVGEARADGRERPTEILHWMCARQHELPAAGDPQPAAEAAWRCARRTHSPRYEIVVQADDTENRIIAAAFDNAGDNFGPVYVWEWAVD